MGIRTITGHPDTADRGILQRNTRVRGGVASSL
jgi:hypothetical protein